MEPRIATLLDQQPYRRLTLDPSVLTAPSTVVPWYIEPASSVGAERPNPDSHSHHEHVDARHKVPHAQSSAPLARVLNDPASPSTFQPSSGQTPQNATFHARSDVRIPGPSAMSPDAPRRDDLLSAGYAGGDVSLIQLPKPPQAPRRTAKRPRIPPLLQGLHQPPPLPPKNKLFPPISERSEIGGDVGDRFALSSAFPASGTEELAQARASPEKRSIPAYDEVEPADAHSLSIVPEHDSSSEVPTETLATATDAGQAKVKTARKRTKWSQKETEDLLLGVSRFGIGRWKQILECADLHFQGRTAVDLKDRFRVCRPGEGLKARKGAAEDSTAKQKGPQGAVPNPWTQPATSPQRPSLEKSDSSDKPNQTEVYGPFLKSQRRARRDFSDADDKNLLEGFKRHGPVWHAMRDDFELGFGMRHATDLRDRFRIRYPEAFANAGFKLKPKEERALNAAKQLKAQETASKASTPTTSRAIEESTTRPAPSKPSTRPTFDLVTDFTFSSDADADADRSPVILNRNILQWADENPPTAPSTTTNPPHQPHASEMLYNPFPSSDGLHINPLATLKLPATAYWTYVGSSPTGTPSSATNPTPFPAPTTSSSAAPSLPPLKHSTSTSTPAPASTQPAASASSNPGSRAHLRTPNLPNIVFPYVPSASARGAVLNLPAPADILCEREGGWDG